MPQFKFRKLDTKPNLAHADTIPGAIYAISHWALKDIPAGWVGRNADGQWVCWNTHGDFWHGFGQSRDAAVTSMWVAPWGQFRRAHAAPVTPC